MKIYLDHSMRNVTLLFNLGILIFSTSYCKSRREVRSSKVVEISENSRRRMPTELELKGVLAVKGGCTAFAVKNGSNRAIVATAAHCTNNYNPETWCAQGGDMWPAKPGAGSIIGEPSDEAKKAKCKAVIAHDPKLDFILLEMDKSIVEQRFEIANFYPAKSTRLNVIGFPIDPLAGAAVGHGNPVLTENCWINDGKGKISQFTDRPTKDVVVNHNCSIYGGNSGGPMLIEGTDIVIGVPGDYVPKDFKNKAWDTVSSEVDLALGLLLELSDEKKSELKLSIVDSQPNVTRNVSYLTISTCSSPPGEFYGPPESQQKMEWIVPIYNSLSGVAAIEVKFAGEKDKKRYSCATDSSCIADDGTVVQIISPLKIRYFFNGSLKSDYTCTQI